MYFFQKIFIVTDLVSLSGKEDYPQHIPINKASPKAKHLVSTDLSRFMIMDY